MPLQNTSLIDSLDAFTTAYLEAALWASELEHYTIEDITVGSIQQAMQDCKNFQETNTVLLTEAYKAYYTGAGEFTPAVLAGHDFWLTRKGHGAGYGARGLGEVGEAIIQASKTYRELNIFEEADRIYIE